VWKAALGGQEAIDGLVTQIISVSNDDGGTGKVTAAVNPAAAPALSAHS